MVNVNQFEKECNCIYKDEQYSVRDNGAVLRHSLDTNKRKRPIDNKWTFGKLNIRTGYLEIASVRIHRIVASAFHREPPSREFVVDHIDTNRQNNRPENLRWVTRLENILLNPITARRIELVCGSVEAFLENPSKFRDKFPDPNYEWMCAVSCQEAQASKERLLNWAQSDKPIQGKTLGEWIYNRSLPKVQIEEELEMLNSLTPNAVQKNWKTPSKFPLCPSKASENPIAEYSSSLTVDKIISTNQYSSSIVVDFASSKDENTLWVMCKSSDVNAVKPFSLMQITCENSLFVHTSLGSFFKKDGAEKGFALAQGLEWAGGETFDDLC